MKPKGNWLRNARPRQGHLLGSLALGILSLVLVSGGQAQTSGDPGAARGGQPSSPGKLQYTNKPQFRLKIDLGDADRSRLREVQLWVKSGAEPWVMKDAAPPAQTHFSFRAPQDGEYWFTIVTVDKNGKATPTDVSREPPAFIVVVDTAAPELNVTLTQAAGRPQGEEVIQCSARDANLDPTTVKLEYQTLDRTWKPLESLPGAPETFRCPDRLGWTGMLRAQASDLARNPASKEVNVLGSAASEPATTPAHGDRAAGGPASMVGTPLPPPPANVQAAAPSAPPSGQDSCPNCTQGKPAASHTAMAVDPQAGRQDARPEKATSGGPDLGSPSGGERQVSYSTSAHEGGLPAQPQREQANVPAAVPQTPREPAGLPQTVAQPAPVMRDPVTHGPGVQRQLINHTHVIMEYRIDQIGPSGVGKVEVWITGDEGKTWQLLCEDADKRSPVEFDLPREGLFGISVVVTNGNGMGDPPPTPGTQPECWVEVDTTRPTAQLLSLRAGNGDEPWCMVVTWAASDKNLGPEPIDLYYATQKEGPWVPIVRGLRNDGSYLWTPPRDAGPQFYLRMDVTDRAGNTTRCDATQPVVLDLARPHAKVLGLSGNAPPKE
jgi:hypothetical protein